MAHLGASRDDLEEALGNLVDAETGVVAAAPSAPPEAPMATGYKGPLPTTWSVAFTGGTIDRCKERAAAYFNMVKEPKAWSKLPPLSEDDAKQLGLMTSDLEKIATQVGLHGRPWKSQGLIYDEVYDFLQDLSLLDTPSAAVAKSRQGHEGGSASGQTPNASWANKLIQTGKSEHATSCNGCFGGQEDATKNVSVLGNFHSGPAVEMCRGLRGATGAS